MTTHDDDTPPRGTLPMANEEQQANGVAYDARVEVEEPDIDRLDDAQKLRLATVCAHKAYKHAVGAEMRSEATLRKVESMEKRQNAQHINLAARIDQVTRLMGREPLPPMRGTFSSEADIDEALAAAEVRKLGKRVVGLREELYRNVLKGIFYVLGLAIMAYGGYLMAQVRTLQAPVPRPTTVNITER